MWLYCGRRHRNVLTYQNVFSCRRSSARQTLHSTYIHIPIVASFASIVGLFLSNINILCHTYFMYNMYFMYSKYRSSYLKHIGPLTSSISRQQRMSASDAFLFHSRPDSSSIPVPLPQPTLSPNPAPPSTLRKPTTM